MIQHIRYRYPAPMVHTRPTGKVQISHVPTEEEGGYRVYSAFSTSDKRTMGYMKCKPSTIIKGDEVVKSLYISDLFSLSSGEGIGTSLLDFARRISGENGCDGNIHLVASGCYAPDRVPHLFYRKYGMNTGEKKFDNKIDHFIKAGKKATRLDFDNKLMFYPPVEYPKANNIFSRAIRFVGSLFNCCKKCVAR